MTAPTPHPSVKNLSGTEWPIVVGALWEENRSSFASGWTGLTHHDQLSIWRLLKLQEDQLRKEATAQLEALRLELTPVPKPPVDNTPTYLKFTVDVEGKPGVEDEDSAEYFMLPRDEALHFVEWYHNFDDWSGLGIHAYVRIVELATIPEDALDVHGQPLSFDRAYDAAGDLYFEER